MEAINQTKLAIAAAREKHGRCRLAHAAKCMYYQCNSFDAEQAMLEAEQAMLEAEQAVLEVAGETTRLELMLSKQVNAPLADGTDVTKRVPRWRSCSKLAGSRGGGGCWLGGCRGCGQRWM